jgi:hypothetical protein
MHIPNIRRLVFGQALVALALMLVLEDFRITTLGKTWIRDSDIAAIQAICKSTPDCKKAGTWSLGMHVAVGIDAPVQTVQAMRPALLEVAPPYSRTRLVLMPLPSAQITKSMTQASANDASMRVNR